MTDRWAVGCDTRHMHTELRGTRAGASEGGPGRREQRKAETRRALHLAALQKFQERGYAETTVRDIAAAAGVTERTFFRYFPSKEDLVLGEIRDLIPVFQDLVRQRPAEETPYQAVYAVALALSAGQPGLGV